MQTITWSSWEREEILQHKSIAEKKIKCWGKVLSELVAFNITWKSLEEWSCSWLQVWECNWAVADLTLTSPFLKICVFVKAITIWFYVSCLSLEPFLLVAWSAPALTCAPASARIAWICILWWQLMPAVMLDVSIEPDLWVLFQQGFSEHCFKSVHSFH